MLDAHPARARREGRRLNRIDNIVTLESVIGKTPAAVSLKVIDHIDATARRWLAASPLMFAGLGGSAGL